MTIQKKLLAFSAVSLLFTAIVGVTGYMANRALDGAMNRNTVAMSALRQHLEAGMMHDALRADVYAALLAVHRISGNGDNVREDVQRHARQFLEAMDTNQVLSLDPNIEAAIVAMRPKIDRYVGNSRALVELALRDPAQAKAKMDDFASVFAALGTEMKALSDLIEQNAAATRAEAEELQMTAKITTLAASCLALACLLAFSLVLTRRITQTLDQAVAMAGRVAAGDLIGHVEVSGDDEAAQVVRALHAMRGTLATVAGTVRGSAEAVKASAKEIADGNTNLSQRTEEQASALEETAASMEELTSSVRQTADAASRACELADTANAAAINGGGVMNDVVATMQDVHASSTKIVDIVGLIEGMAFQTNILSLNAAVEAARAGEHGRGFAVVAGEVRALAQQSAAAANQVKALIDSSVSKVLRGAQRVQDAGRAMDEIIASVEKVYHLIQEISAAAQEQSSGIDQISRAISQMDDVTQQNAALVEEAAASAKALETQADRLVEAIAVFKLKTQPAPTAPRQTAAAPADAPSAAIYRFAERH